MGLKAEAWTMPTSATFEKKFDITSALAGSTGIVALSEYADDTLLLPADYSKLDDLVSASNRSWIVIKRGSTVIDEFKAERIQKIARRPGQVSVTGVQRNGLIEGIGVYPKVDRVGAQDWKWGFENILPDLSLAALGHIREEWELYNDATGGTFTITVDGQTTTALNHNATADQVEGFAVTGTGLQGLSNVNDVTVSGTGTQDDPWVITFYSPPDPTTVTVTDSLTGGSSTLTKKVEGGLDPSPITISKPVDAEAGEPDQHGEYDEPALEVTTDNNNTGSDWALLVNATARFAGSQILVDVVPGETYGEVSVPVEPTVSGDYTIVVRDIYGGLIAEKRDVALTAGSYQTLSLADVKIPAGMNQVILRVAVTDATPANVADFYVDWQGARFVAGEAEATFTEILRVLLEDAQNRSTATWLELDASDAADTNGLALTAISFTAFVGNNAHMGHVMADGADLGYHWRIVPAADAAVTTPAGTTTHVLQVFYSTGYEIEDLTGAVDAPYVYAGASVADAEVVERIPPFTVQLGLGSGALKLEDTNPTEVTSIGRIERVVDVEHLGTEAAIQLFHDAAFAEEESNRKAARAEVLGTARKIPGVDYGEGSKIWWQFPGILAREARVVRRFSWTFGNPDRFEVGGSETLSPEAAMAKAVDRLLNVLERRRRGGGGPNAAQLQQLSERQDHGKLLGLRDDDHWVYLTRGRHDRIGHSIYYDELVDSGRITLATASIQTAANPTKDAGNPLFPPSSEAEDTSAWDRDKSYVSVVRREDSDSPTGYRWHMFYTGGDTNGANIHTGYASSTDGVTWTKPSLSRVAHGGSAANNILRTGFGNHTIYDEYSGLWVSVEEDFTNSEIRIYTQEKPTDPPTQVKALSPSQINSEGKSIVRRPSDGRWIVYYVSGHVAQDRNVYAFISDTPDLDGTWTEYGIILDAPDQDNQYYTLYPSAIGDQILYTVSRYNKTNEQITVDLFVSRNGVDLTSVKSGWIGLGSAGAWDDELVIASHITEEGDSWHVYYTGSPANHAATNRDARIGRATISRGRVGSAGTTGTITTDYMHVGPGAVLTVNADASGGTLEIEVQDENGDAITGFTQADCDDITTSAFDHYPTWGQETIPSGTVRLVFHLTTNVTIYSFQLTNTVPASAVSGSSSALGDLSDVTITSATLYDRLHYNGTAWVNTNKIWKPLLDADGAIVTDGNGDPTMGLAPA